MGDNILSFALKERVDPLGYLLMVSKGQSPGGKMILEKNQEVFEVESHVVIESA